MQLEVEERGPVERRLRIELPTAEVDKVFDHVFHEIGKSARLKGFRPGRVPREVLERYFAHEARHEALEHLIRHSLPKAIEQAALEVIGEPRLEPDEEPRAGLPFRYAVALEIRPKIELKQVRGLAVKRPILPEPEGDPVESYLEEARQGHAQLVAEPEGTLAARGHVAVLDFEGRIDGKTFEGGSGKEVTLELGAGTAIPGFDEQVEGMVVGGERDFDLSVPESYPAAAVAGKTAHFHVRLVELKRKELPALDDEFAKDVSEAETLDALRGQLRERMEQGRERERERRLREAVVAALVEANPFPVPPSLVASEINARLARVLRQLRVREETPELRAQIERWREEMRPQAERAVALSLLAPVIASAEGISVGEEEVDARVRQMAEAEERPYKELRRALSERGMLDGLRAGLVEERVVELATSAATLSDA
jgi:trigger factor